MKKMAANNPKMRFLRIDTGINPVDEIVNKVLSEIDSCICEVSC